jgi:hypothetical protein
MRCGEVSRQGVLGSRRVRRRGISSASWLGIGLAVLLVVILAVVLYWRLVGWPSGPVAIRKHMLERIELPAGIESIVPRMPADAGNSADDYAQIRAEYQRRTEEFRTFLRIRFEQINASTAVAVGTADHLRAGARKKEFRWYFEKTPKEFDLFSRDKDLEILGEVTDKAVYQIATVYGAQQNPGERALWEDYLIYGWHLCQQRVRVGLFWAGLQAQLNAATNLADMYQEAGQAEKAKAANDYVLALKRTEQALGNKLSVVKRIQVRIGDLFHVIENDKDRMWRVEALLMLGFRRHTVSQPADRKRAQELLERFSGDADEFIAAAARAAKAVTADQTGNVDHAF